jgi:hypothetical protein
MAKAKPEENTPVPMPSEGGSYSRDPATGELTRLPDEVEETPIEGDAADNQIQEH